MRRIMIDCSEMNTFADAHDCLGDISEETHVILLNTARLESALGVF